MGANENKSESVAGHPESVWGIAVVLFVIGAIAIPLVMKSPAEQVKEVAEKQTRYDEYQAAEKKLSQSKIEGAKALEDADKAIRNEAAERRASFEKASFRTTMSNKDGVRIDRYFLKNGRTITCTTAIFGNSPAMFNCDGTL